MDNAEEHSLPTESTTQAQSDEVQRALNVIQAMTDEKRIDLIDDIFRYLPAAGLDTVISKAQQAKQERHAADQKAFLAEIARLEARASQLGLKVFVQPQADGKSGTRRSKPKSEAQTPSKGRRYPPGIYRDPETGEEWKSGRRPPKWLKDYEAQGHDAKEFLVKAEEHAEEQPQSAGGERQTENEQPQEGATG